MNLGLKLYSNWTLLLSIRCFYFFKAYFKKEINFNIDFTTIKAVNEQILSFSLSVFVAVTEASSTLYGKLALQSLVMGFHMMRG